jgi:hypothetical protein
MTIAIAEQVQKKLPTHKVRSHVIQESGHHVQVGS